MNSNTIKTFCATRLLPAAAITYVSVAIVSAAMYTGPMWDGHRHSLFMFDLQFHGLPFLLLCLMARRVVSFWTIATVMIGFPFSLLATVSEAGSFERVESAVAIWNAASFVGMLLVVGWVIKQAVLLDKIAHGSKFQGWIKSLTE